jgi:hypothetical protein
MYEWYKASEDNCARLVAEPNPAGSHLDFGMPRPCFSPQFISQIDMLSRLAFVAG